MNRPARRGEAAVLVHVRLEQDRTLDDAGEFHALACSAGADVRGSIQVPRRQPDPRWFIGSGKVEAVAAMVRDRAAELVLVDHHLSPSQERNLERRLGCRVLDRTGLILDIFAQRARSFEGKLQVELAQLRHLSTRLVRGWTHLERQKGGIGLRGPGETQLEMDRRLIGIRIRQLRQRLERVRRQRRQGRRARNRAGLPTLSIVGYTNAGKSTLFNALTGASVHSADQLFATLDPTLRRLELPGLGPVILADTVGFVRKLPHDLVAAFQSTLEETREADLLLHLVDASDPCHRERVAQVDRVLAEIGAAEVPQLRLYNKIDRAGLSPRVQHDDRGRVVAVWMSATTGAGLDLLRQALVECLGSACVEGWLPLPAAGGRLRARLFAAGAVAGEALDASGRSWLHVRLPQGELCRLCRGEGVDSALQPVPDFLAGGVQPP